MLCRLTLVLLCAAPLIAEPMLVDPLTDASQWQLGGQRINYVLGRSSVAASTEHPRPGYDTALRLTYDFTEPRRSWLSYYHLGKAVPGDCRELSFQLFGDESGARLRLSLEDARGRWFQREAGRVDWSGWREVTVPVNDGSWRPLTRIGEEPLPPLMPIDLKEIAVVRNGAEQPSGAIWISELRAEIEIRPLDRIDLELSSKRPGNVIAAGKPIILETRITNHGSEAVDGQATEEVLDYLGHVVTSEVREFHLNGNQELLGGTSCAVSGEGSFTYRLTIAAGDHRRVWFHRFAVVQDTPAQGYDPASQFGIWGNVAGLSRQEEPLAERLNADSRCGWTRIGFSWPQINPRPGVFAWDGAGRTAGAKGLALVGSTATLQLPDDPRFDVPDGLTIAFWSKLDGGNGNWQWPIFHEGPSGERERGWGVFFHRDTGEFVFSAGFAGRSDLPHADLGSGFKAWDGQWHHCAVTYDPAAHAVIFYVDGQAVRSVDQPNGQLRPVRSPVRIGSSFAGLLDELRIYDRALPAAGIAALAAKQSGPVAGLLAGWTFDEPDGAFQDLSGHGFDLAPADPQPVQLAQQAREQGIAVLGILGFPPDWASTAPEDAARPWVYEPKLEAWETYVEQTVRHYAEVVDHWELWNEPNISVFWEPEPNPQAFARIAIAGYHAAKRGNPNAVVMTPGLAGPHGNGSRMEFLDAILAAGVKDATDAVSIHPYRQTTPEASDLAGELRHIHDASGGKPIWYTEMCWTNQIPGGSTESRTAQMLARCFALSIGSGLVDKIIWFRFHDPGVDRFYTEHNYGLCWNDLTPKPAWFAYRTCTRLLDHAVPAGDWDLGSGAMGRLFETAEGRVAVLWSPDGSTPAAVKVGAEQVTQVDLMGNATTVPTPGGVWLGNLDETALFLTGLGPEAAPGNSPLTVEVPRLIAGQRAALRIEVTNPQPRPTTMRLAFDDPSVGPGQPGGELPLTAGERRTFEVGLAAGAEPDSRTLTVTLQLGEQRLTRTVTIAVHSTAADAGPIGWWKLDEGQGTTFADSSPSGSSGTVEAPEWVSGKDGQALRFSGGGIATVAASPKLDCRDEVTVAFWIKLEADTGTWQFPVTRFFNENVIRNYGVYLAPGELQPAFSTSPVDDPSPHRDVRAGIGLTTGQWHHVAASYGMFDGVCRVYVDGQLSATDHLGGPMKLVSDQPLRLGVGTRAVIDDVMVWSRVLSEDEVARLAE